MRTTIKDIAQRTGLSYSTVSRALHDESSPYVSQRTRAKVREVARELGYVPNVAARALVTGMSNSIALLVIDEYAPFYAGIARELCRIAEERGFTVAAERVTARDRREGPPSFLRWPLAGALSVDGFYVYNDKLRFLRDQGTPVVEMGHLVHHEFDHVHIDLAVGTDEVLDHLASTGRQRIAMVGNRVALEVGDPRALRYRERLQSEGRQPEWIVIDRQGRGIARESIKAYIEANGLPDALFCINDDVAIGCLKGLHDLGIDVPRQVAVVGCDGLEDTEFHTPAITTLIHPVARMVSSSLEVLLNRIADRDMPVQSVVLAPTLVIRESS